MSQETIRLILQQLDNSVVDFIEGLPATQRRVYSRLLELTKELELDKLGSIKNNLQNIKILSSIRREVEAIVISQPYLNKVKAFVETYDTLAKLQNTYFTELNVKFKPKAVLEELKKVNVQTTVDQLTESGIGGSFSNDIKTVLQRNIVSGGSYSSLTESLRAAIIGSDGEDGRLVKYAKQITVDAINQYNAQYTKAITEDLGLEWFIYQGNNIKTSRDFCIHMTAKRFFHESEIPELLRGNIDGKKIPTKDGKPLGMYPDTNKDNFVILRGGFRCQHQIFPVTEAAVPKELVEKFQEA